MFYYLAGLALMTLAALKNRLRGYDAPTEFDASDLTASERHAIATVQTWQECLGSYTGGEHWKDKDILELGPGGTLATGAILLRDGARSYRAFDKYNLSLTIPDSFYHNLLGGHSKALKRWRSLGSDVLIVDSDFGIDMGLEGRYFDLIVSCAAFEHFTDVPDSMARLTKILRPGAVLCSVVDMQTHTRWIRTVDPNNIYRFNDDIYWSLDYPGKPNRLRPDEYIDILKNLGWKDVEFRPLTLLSPEAPRNVDKKFRRPGAAMEVLNGALLARWPG